MRLSAPSRADSGLTLSPNAETFGMEEPPTGLSVERVSVDGLDTFEYALTRKSHYLCLVDCWRDAGETRLEGVAVSREKAIRGTLTFVPAGHRFAGWSTPSSDGHKFAGIYIDPSIRLADDDFQSATRTWAPSLYFSDPGIRSTAEKLVSLIDTPGYFGRLYAETLGSTLIFELARRYAGALPPRSEAVRGGLAGWQLKRVCDYLEANLAEDVSLAELAAIARLSAQHFCRAFQRSTGLPPHRYHLQRRIERAKAMLCGGGLRVTDVALAVGFGGSSQFATAFKRATGVPPREYRRSR